MSEKVVGQVSAGSHPIYEVVESGDDVIIRHVEDPHHAVKIMRSAVATLVDVLKKVR